MTFSLVAASRFECSLECSHLCVVQRFWVDSALAMRVFPLSQTALALVLLQGHDTTLSKHSRNVTWEARVSVQTRMS